MNTMDLHRRFWQRMGEYYGRKWFESYGEQPLASWVEVLNKFTPKDVGAAFELLKKDPGEFPPNLPTFEDLLIRAARANRAGESEQDWRRGVWRSFVIEEVRRAIGLDWQDFERKVIEHRDTLGRAMLDLLNDLESLEAKTGQRTDGQIAHGRERAIAIAKHWSWIAQREAA